MKKEPIQNPIETKNETQKLLEISPKTFSLLTEGMKLKSIHTIPDIKACVKTILPTFSTIAGKCDNSPKVKSATINEDALCEYNKEICQLMNEFYYSPIESKEKIAKVLEAVKVICDKDVANSVFVS